MFPPAVITVDTGGRQHYKIPFFANHFPCPSISQPTAAQYPFDLDYGDSLLLDRYGWEHGDLDGRGVVWYWLRKGVERNQKDTGDGDAVDAEQPTELEWRYLKVKHSTAAEVSDLEMELDA
ncbi:hypothetical protein R3P38DRAFT_3201057 [Favolaschia claudopus]|uniref:Uncharacterized protein n=1 Tax=Favolaschia claudopus TaxID=2862362 RepID=A0AAW0AZ79_9AGAR